MTFSDQSPKNPDKNSICFTITNFKDNFAILKNNFGEIIWPQEKIPKNLRIGDQLWLQVADHYEEEQYQIQRKLLEELIN